MPARLLTPVHAGARGRFYSGRQPLDMYGDPQRDYFVYAAPQQAGESTAPTANTDGSWTCTLPALSSPMSTRRCEIHWGIDGRGGLFKHGDTIWHVGEMIGQLGEAGADPAEWHVVTQLHSATSAGEWTNPAVAMIVSGGYLHLRGGAGHPNSGSGPNSYAWNHVLAPWVDGRRYRYEMRIHVDNGADAWIDLTLDGTKILDRWVPEGQYNGQGTGRYPGVIYAERNTPYAWCMQRNALYRGSNDNTPPTYAQWVRHWPILLGIDRGVPGHAAAPMTDGDTAYGWHVEYASGGHVTPQPDGSVMYQPAWVTADTTAAVLAVSERTFTGDRTIRATWATLEQRPDNPNPWETGWLFWNYSRIYSPGSDQGIPTPDEWARSGYYLALKPNGWELGKLDQRRFAGGQKYLATGSTPTTPIGTRRNVVITQTVAQITVTIDGEQVAQVTDDQASSSTWVAGETTYTSGAVCMYSEDAKVHFTNLTVTQGSTTTTLVPV